MHGDIVSHSNASLSANLRAASDDTANDGTNKSHRDAAQNAVNQHSKPGPLKSRRDPRAWLGEPRRAPDEPGNEFFAREFWRFVLVQQKVAELAKTAIDYPPMQDSASFNLEAVKKRIEAGTREHHGR